MICVEYSLIFISVNLYIAYTILLENYTYLYKEKKK